MTEYDCTLRRQDAQEKQPESGLTTDWAELLGPICLGSYTDLLSLAYPQGLTYAELRPEYLKP